MDLQVKCVPVQLAANAAVSDEGPFCCNDTLSCMITFHFGERGKAGLISMALLLA
jgi:hypothetical protein